MPRTRRSSFTIRRSRAPGPSEARWSSWTTAGGRAHPSVLRSNGHTEARSSRCTQRLGQVGVQDTGPLGLHWKDSTGTAGPEHPVCWQGGKRRPRVTSLHGHRNHLGLKVDRPRIEGEGIGVWSWHPQRLRADRSSISTQPHAPCPWSLLPTPPVLTVHQRPAPPLKPCPGQRPQALASPGSLPGVTNGGRTSCRP